MSLHNLSNLGEGVVKIARSLISRKWEFEVVELCGKVLGMFQTQPSSYDTSALSHHHLIGNKRNLSWTAYWIRRHTEMKSRCWVVQQRFPTPVAGNLWATPRQRKCSEKSILTVPRTHDLNRSLGQAISRVLERPKTKCSLMTFGVASCELSSSPSSAHYVRKSVVLLIMLLFSYSTKAVRHEGFSYD